MKIPTLLLTLLLVSLLPAVQAGTPDLPSTAAVVSRTSGDSGENGLTDCPPSYTYYGNQPYAIQTIHDCVYVCEGHVLNDGQWTGTCVLVGTLPLGSTALLARSEGETCSNYGIEVVVSIGNTCRFGTCENQGILVVVTTGGYCGHGLVDACVGDQCVFPKRQSALGSPNSAPLVPSQELLVAFAANECGPPNNSGIRVAVWAPGLCIVNVDFSCKPLPCLESDLLVLASTDSSDPLASAVVARFVSVGDCEVNPSLWGALLCGEKGEVCSIMDSVECWAGRMVCYMVRGPAHAIRDTSPIRRVGEEFCTVQPSASAASVTVPTSYCVIGPRIAFCVWFGSASAVNLAGASSSGGCNYIGVWVGSPPNCYAVCYGNVGVGFAVGADPNGPNGAGVLVGPGCTAPSGVDEQASAGRIAPIYGGWTCGSSPETGVWMGPKPGCTWGLCWDGVGVGVAVGAGSPGTGALVGVGC